MITIAYNPSTGTQLWQATYQDPRGDANTAAAAVAVSPDSTKVFVTGSGYPTSPDHGSFETVAFDGATGAFLWATPYDGPPDGQGDNFATDVTVSDGGSTVIVTGASHGNGFLGYDFATLAY